MTKRYNKPIPFGWYAVEYTDKLANGDVKPVQYFGKELVLFRSESGQATMLDAYCPHLGAHLGHGGVVKGEGVACPFHAWKFDNTGTCVDVPYAKRIPTKVDGKPCLKSYPVVEKNKMIWAWYHPKDEAPLFDVETLEELNSDEWTDLDTYDWTINSIIQETGENAADLAHFITVHSAAEMPQGEVTMEGHVRRTLMDSQSQKIDEDGNIDRESGGVEATRLDAYSYGPGQSFQRFSRTFDFVMMGTITPIDDQSIHLRFNFSLPKAQVETNAVYTNAIRDEIVYQVGQDIPIWEHKIYKENPILCDGDGPIARYRKWFQQFYAE
jgi:3-ketosteroid 9alpha-monooxygenase subunit A